MAVTGTITKIVASNKFKNNHITRLKCKIKFQKCFLNKIGLIMLLIIFFVLFPQIFTFYFIIRMFVGKSRIFYF
jgi:hypothetical protein